ncbi:hypothetical protein MCOR19_004987 [Pyricularia oryzae]|uniref:Transcription factor tfiiic complex subunit tfc6 n=1 Tax=Pyricularia oryzae TaxID=318829 RepID=A0A4P7NCD5_PYROR|nr:hypothetical protein MCOR19_004987 [Pyricularia oryzae]KAI6408889.1 hypothetical protein MCOR20_005255 [Pyricularia oryzae]KAI6485379.1 hypothetical protein MCOR18_003788 [Pyricularia oryzae]KAI6578720.1 hypothetical protein MCOR06_010444 [Pyricularia oryzae]KAI6617204.1 hypothetical protein MCOR08_009352 [Pyricularia oryzae]
MSARRSTRARRATYKAVDYGLDDDVDGEVEVNDTITPSKSSRRQRKPSVNEDGDFENGLGQDGAGQDQISDLSAAEDDEVQADESDVGYASHTSSSRRAKATAKTPKRQRKNAPTQPKPSSRQTSTPASKPARESGTVDVQTEDPTDLGPEKNGDAASKVRWRLPKKKKSQAAYRASLKVVSKRKGPPETDGELWRYVADNLNKSLRVYLGPLQRHDRFGLLLETVYGPDVAAVALADNLRLHYVNHVLPDRGLKRRCCVMPSPWVPGGFEAEQRKKFHAWYRQITEGGTASQRLGTVPAKRKKKLLPESTKGDLITFIGPHDSQKPVVIPQGSAITLSEKDESVTDEAQQPTGSLFDVGGVPLAIGWAPRADPDAAQILAIAVSPHSDYAFYRTEKAVPKEDKTAGSVQFWRFESELDGDSVRRPCRKPPQRVSAICFDWGRVTRLQWCPVAPVTKPGSLCGVIAVLCEGQVHIVEVKEPEVGSETQFDWIQTPIATISLKEEETGIVATCFTWVNVNRIAVGFKDGTIGIWSIQPLVLISRQVVHHAEMLDICSGYPSHPYLITSVPLGGCPAITDFTDPSQETAAHTTPSAVFQPNMLDWCEHMQGFLSTYANSTPGSTTVAFLAMRYPSQLRTVFQGFSQPMCLSAGKTHCYTLIGCADGSLWSFNTMRKVFYLRGEKLYKIKLFQHEYRKANEAQTPDGDANDEDTAMQDADQENTDGKPQIRGAVRILHGFKPEINDNPRNDHSRAVMKKAREKAKAKAKRTTARKGDSAAANGCELVERTERDDYPEEHNPLKGIMLHEPETRVVLCAWNPNVELGWWAAAAMGSGLVRVMDLGLD